MMSPEDIAQLRKEALTFRVFQKVALLKCLDEIERLNQVVLSQQRTIHSLHEQREYDRPTVAKS